jgi:hypothetical protein
VELQRRVALLEGVDEGRPWDEAGTLRGGSTSWGHPSAVRTGSLACRKVLCHSRFPPRMAEI